MSEQTTLDWTRHSNCLNSDPDLFFPVGIGPTAQAQEADAKRVCDNCWVKAQCLDWAVSTKQYAGVWGGLSEAERAPMYETPERSMTRCFNQQEWIEEQLAQKRQQKAIARDLGVDPHVLCRAISRMRAEQEASVLGVEGVAA